jgi:hypothetical protein
MVSALYLLTGLGFNVIGGFVNGVAETPTVLKISALTLAIYIPLGPALTSLWGPYGLLIAYILSSATSTLYGLRQVSLNFGPQPDLKNSARILLDALFASLPAAALLQLYATGTSLVNLIVGGRLFLVA